MKKLVTVLALVSVAAVSAQANNSKFGLEVSFGATSLVTVSPTLTSWQNKVLIEAREDISYFVATDGAVRTARFNQAMAHLRAEIGDQQSSDMDLAQAILAEIQ